VIAGRTSQRKIHLCAKIARMVSLERRMRLLYGQSLVSGLLCKFSWIINMVFCCPLPFVKVFRCIVLLIGLHLSCVGGVCRATCAGEGFDAS
jgi:hypothetical protein